MASIQSSEDKKQKRTKEREFNAIKFAIKNRQRKYSFSHFSKGTVVNDIEARI
jgi:hypothetical protein